MSFPSTFGTQVAAIMEVLAKAAVAEITKLVEEGSVVLRLEVRRRDTEIQDLLSRLKMMEAELIKAQEDAARRITQEEEQLAGQGTATAGSQILQDGSEDHDVDAAYPNLKPAELLCEDFSGLDESRHISPGVKHESEDEFHSTESEDHTDVVGSKAGDQGDFTWNDCSMFENSSVTTQQHAQMFPSNTEQYSACRNAQNPLHFSSSPRQELADDCLAMPIKVEEMMHPVSMGNSTLDSVFNKDFRHDLFMQAASQQAGPSAALPQRSTAGTSESNKEDSPRTRIYLKTKRIASICKTSQKYFICSECNKSFSYLSQLEQHRTTHQTLKPFRCLECGKFFTQKTRLKTHQRVHTGERPFSCRICGKMFSRQDNCQRHERFHSGVKPFNCKQCGKGFTTLGKLKMHEEVHLLGR